LPTVPTIAEAGLEGFEFAPWFGLFAPAQTPPAILDRLHSAVEKVLKDPALVARFAQLDLDVAPKSRDDFARLYDADVAKRAEATKTLGIQPR
jgi:tripartite-type tricarboxylate transporter receptor subunit TctC